MTPAVQTLKSYWDQPGAYGQKYSPSHVPLAMSWLQQHGQLTPHTGSVTFVPTQYSTLYSQRDNHRNEAPKEYKELLVIVCDGYVFDPAGHYIGVPLGDYLTNNLLHYNRGIGVLVDKTSASKEAVFSYLTPDVQSRINII